VTVVEWVCLGTSLFLLYTARSFLHYTFSEMVTGRDVSLKTSSRQHFHCLSLGLTVLVLCPETRQFDTPDNERDATQHSLLLLAGWRRAGSLPFSDGSARHQSNSVSDRKSRLETVYPLSWSWDLVFVLVLKVSVLVLVLALTNLVPSLVMGNSCLVTNKW